MGCTLHKPCLCCAQRLVSQQKCWALLSICLCMSVLCAGTMGLKGDLTAGEIVEQLVHAQKVTTIKNVVYMVSWLPPHV